MNLRRALSPFPLTLLLVACGGGGSGTPSVPPVVDDAAEDSACSGDYYQTAIDTYTGTVDYDASGQSAEGGSICQWQTTVEIAPRDIGTGRCDLGARVTSTVEQSVVLPAESAFASECVEADDVLVIDDPLAAVENPVLSVDYTLPIRLSFQNRETEPDRGPYFGDDSVSVRYVRLFGGLVPEVDFFEIDEDGITLGQRNPSPDRALSGRLKRE